MRLISFFATLAAAVITACLPSAAAMAQTETTSQETSTEATKLYKWADGTISPVVVARPQAGAGDVVTTSMNATAATGGIGYTCRLPASAASINAATCYNGAVRLYVITCYNTTGSVKYLKVYNKGASVPDPATDTPVWTITLKPTDTTTVNWGAAGLSLSTGLGYIVVGGVADSSATTVAANDVTGCNFAYQR